MEPAVFGGRSLFPLRLVKWRTDTVLVQCGSIEDCSCVTQLVMISVVAV